MNRKTIRYLGALYWAAASGLAQAQTEIASSAGPGTEAQAVPPADDHSTVVVTGRRSDAAPQAPVPGATVSIDAAEVRNRHLVTLADLLAAQPGIFIESAGNTGAPKISIRGSGINEGHLNFRSGIFYQFDGLPLTGPAGTAFELWNPQDLARTDVAIGAAGIGQGAAEFGGAINFVTKTGYDAPLLQARVDVGSYGFVGEQVSSGRVIGPFDYYVSISHFKADNFLSFSNSRATRVTANLGYQASDRLSLRLQTRYSKNWEQDTYGISKAQLEADPRVTSALNIQDNSQRINPGTYWIGANAIYETSDHGSLTVGADYHHYPVIGLGLVFGTTRWAFNDLGLSLRYKHADTLFGLPSATTLYAVGTRAVNSSVTGYRGNTQTGNYYATRVAKVKYDGSTDLRFGLTNDLTLTDRLTLANAIGGVYARRVNDKTAYTPSPGGLTGSDADRVDVQGRLGLRYALDRGIEAYGAVSRTVQFARAYDTVRIADASYILKAPLEPQKALNYELGVKGAKGVFTGSFSLYRSDLRDELLGAKVNPTDARATVSNVSPTLHQGVEAALDTILWRSEPERNGGRSAVLFKQAYTYLDARYKHDALWGDNDLPGVPRHYYQGELQFQHGSGAYVGANLKAVSSYYVDYANSFKADAYTMYGLELGYAPNEGKWNAYLQLKNLTNKHYASNVLTQYNLGGRDANLVFYPGDGFSVFGGIGVNF